MYLVLFFEMCISIANNIEGFEAKLQIHLEKSVF